MWPNATAAADATSLSLSCNRAVSSSTAATSRRTPIELIVPISSRPSSDSLAFRNAASASAPGIASNAIRERLVLIKSHAEFIAGIAQSGGRTSLFINLPGTAHRGEILDAGLLRLAGDLGINFGFEIFPDWDGEPTAGEAIVT